MGILGGTYADGTAVDMYVALLIYSTWIDGMSSYDCNGSDTQKWQWNGDTLTSVNPVDESQWCLDAGVDSQCKYIFFKFTFIPA